MTHDTALTSVKQLPVPTPQQVVESLTEGSQGLMKPEKRRGRRATVTGMHLCLAIVLCGLEGFGSQLALWRRICMEAVGPFAPVWVVDQAIYNRLERVSGVMELFFEQVSSWMRQHLEGWQDRSLAPFATQVVALDESTLDVMGRWLSDLRSLAAGDPQLLAGRISALFDVRLQQWVRVEVLRDATANCKLHARTMISQLQAGVLVLFDRGYLSFPWFDELTEGGLWWISRYGNRVSYQVRQVLYQGDGVFDAIVVLGAHRSDRAKHPVRMVQYYHHGELRRYFTNVLDAQQLPLQDIVRLYARRWDIELAFGVLKEHLHVGQIWSAKWSVILVQVWCGLLLAQLFHGLQVQLAMEAGVEPFEVSVDLLVRLVPRLLQRGEAPIPYLLRYGRELGVIRPSSRVVIQTPWIDPSWVSPPDPEAVKPREQARSARRKCEPRPRSTTKKVA